MIRVSSLIGMCAYAFYKEQGISIKVPVANVTLFSLAHLLRENTDSELRLGTDVYCRDLLALAIVAAWLLEPK
ncbi:hypothetical protein Tco_0127856 [Tanacetum coccineum]